MVTIIDAPKSTPTKVSLGCKVELEDVETGDIHLYQVVGSAEADPTPSRPSFPATDQRTPRSIAPTKASLMPV